MISVIASAVKTQYWLNLYQSLLDNKMPFEIVFAGHTKPNFELPNNFHYIHSGASPVTCVEIAYRKSVGDFIICTGDDHRFSPAYLDTLYKWYVRLRNDKFIVGSRGVDSPADMPLIPDASYTISHPQYNDGCLKCFKEDMSPVMMFPPLIPRKAWEECGGVDSRFWGVNWNMDFQLRLYKSGYLPFIAVDAYSWEIRPETKKGRLSKREQSRGDRGLLKSLWQFDKDGIDYRRTDKVKGFKF